MPIHAPEAHSHLQPAVPRIVPAQAPELATRAMRRFSCIGAACEDTCCRDFGIAMDAPSLQQVRAAVARDAERKDKVVRLVVLGPPRSDGGGELLKLNDHGACPALEGDGGCNVHRQFGEQALGTACSVFPRTALAVADRVEVTGSLACPELARLTLLAADGLDQTPAAAGTVLPRPYVGKTVDVGATADEYQASFLDVRAALLALFARDGVRAGTRLAFAANLADQIGDFFLKGGAMRMGSQRSFSRRRLAVDLEAARTCWPRGTAICGN